MPRVHPFLGIDIGSSAIRAIVAEVDHGNMMRIIAHAAGESKGLRRGQVVDMGQVTQALGDVLEHIERAMGFRIDRAAVNISGQHVGVTQSRGVVAVSRADNEIAREDVSRVLAAAQAVPLGTNREVLHVIPQEFVVDGERGLKNVIGMSGVRLEVMALLFQVSSPMLRNLERAVVDAGVQPEQFVISSLAASEAALSERARELGAVLLDLGAGTTDLAVFEEGECIHAAVLPVGAGHITNDIAIGMRSSLDVAERAKIEFGTCMPAEIGKREMFTLSTVGSEDAGEFSRRELAEIIAARVEELLGLAQKELKKIGRDRLLPAGLVLVGGGAKLSGIEALARETFALPVHLGLSEEMASKVSESFHDPSFATTIGLVRWQAGNMDERGASLRIPSVGKGVDQIKKFLRNLLP